MVVCYYFDARTENRFITKQKNYCFDKKIFFSNFNCHTLELKNDWSPAGFLYLFHSLSNLMLIKFYNKTKNFSNNYWIEKKQSAVFNIWQWCIKIWSNSPIYLIKMFLNKKNNNNKKKKSSARVCHFLAMLFCLATKLGVKS